MLATAMRYSSLRRLGPCAPPQVMTTIFRPGRWGWCVQAGRELLSVRFARQSIDDVRPMSRSTSWQDSRLIDPISKRAHLQPSMPLVHSVSIRGVLRQRHIQCCSLIPDLGVGFVLRAVPCPAAMTQKQGNQALLVR